MKESKRYNSEGVELYHKVKEKINFSIDVRQMCGDINRDILEIREVFELFNINQSKTLKEWIELAEKRLEQLKSKDKEIEELKRIIEVKDAGRSMADKHIEKQKQELQRLREGLRESKLVVDWLQDNAFVNPPDQEYFYNSTMNLLELLNELLTTSKEG